MLFPRPEACQLSQSLSASADLSLEVTNVTDDVSYTEISRMPLSCPCLPGHYRRRVGRSRVRTSAVKQYLLDTAGITVAATMCTKPEQGQA